MVMQDGGHPMSAYLPPLDQLHDPRSLPAETWNTGLCDCMDDANSCMEVGFCGYIALGYTYNKLTTGITAWQPAMCIGPFIVDLLLKGAAYAFAMVVMRQKLRQRFNLDPESHPLSECLKGFCCVGCTHCQIQRELTIRGYFPGGMICNTSPSVHLHPKLNPHQMQ